MSAFPFLELLEPTLRGTRALDCSASLEGAAEVPEQRSPPGWAGLQEQRAGAPRVLGGPLEESSEIRAPEHKADRVHRSAGASQG